MAEHCVKIGYWKGLKGRGDIVAQVCIHAGVKCEMEDVTPDMIEKLSKEIKFFNLPYIRCGENGEKTLTETNAIILAICMKHKPDLMGKTQEDKILNMQISGVIGDLIQGAFKAACTGSESCHEDIKELMKTVVAKNCP